MQQSVLISSIRGADGLHKDHISKYILRWLRRCVLISAFEGRALESPTEDGGGSFTGPLKNWSMTAELRRQFRATGYYQQAYDTYVLDQTMTEYLRCTDEIPHHFHMHVLHAAQIIGYKHPDSWTRSWWNKFYNHMVSDAHLYPESEQLMDRRLGDVEAQWKERELVPAADVPKVQAAPYVALYVVKHQLTDRYFESRELENEYWTEDSNKAYRFTKEDAEKHVLQYAATAQKFMQVIFHSSAVV